MFTIGARLAMNSAGWTTGLKTAASATKNFGKSVAKDVGKDFATDVAKGVVSNVVTGLFRAIGFRLGSAAGGSQGTGGGGVRGKFGLAIAAAGAGAAYLAKQGLNAVSEVKDLSEQSDLSTTSVQRLKKAAENSGLEFRHFATSLAALEGSRRNAGEGDEDSRKQFERFGVTLADLQNPAMTTLDILNKIGQAIIGVKLDPRQSQDLRDLGGKHLPKLGNALRELQGMGPDGIDIISEGAVKRLDGINKGVESIMRKVRGFSAEWMDVLLGGVSTVLHNFNDRIDGSVTAKLHGAFAGIGSLAKDALTWSGRATLSGLSAIPFVGPALGGAAAFAGSKIAGGLQGITNRPPALLAREGSPFAVPPTEQPEQGPNEPLFEDKEKKRLMKDIAEAELDLLTDTERELRIRQQLLETERQIRAARGQLTPGAEDTNPILLLRKEQLEKQKELKQLREGGIKNVQDDLARVGGFTANAGGQQRLQERIARASEETAVNTRRGGNRRDLTGLV